MELREDVLRVICKKEALLLAEVGDITTLKSYKARWHVNLMRPYAFGYILSYNLWKKVPRMRCVQGAAGVRKASKHKAFRERFMKDLSFHLPAFMQSFPL